MLRLYEDSDQKAPHPGHQPCATSVESFPSEATAAAPDPAVSVADHRMPSVGRSPSSGTSNLYRITLVVEAADPDEATAIHENVIRVACPFEFNDDHPDHCPRRWITMMSRLDDDEAAQWDDSLNG